MLCYICFMIYAICYIAIYICSYVDVVPPSWSDWLTECGKTNTCLSSHRPANKTWRTQLWTDHHSSPVTPVWSITVMSNQMCFLHLTCCISPDLIHGAQQEEVESCLCVKGGGGGGLQKPKQCNVLKCRKARPGDCSDWGSIFGVTLLTWSLILHTLGTL